MSDEAYLEWGIDWRMSRRDREPISDDEASQLAEDLALWFKERGYLVGGGITPVDDEGTAWQSVRDRLAPWTPTLSSNAPASAAPTTVRSLASATTA